MTGTITSTNTNPFTAQTEAEKLRNIFQPTSASGFGMPGGMRGDILARLRGATVIAGSRDTEKNVEVAGFFGAQTFGSQGSQSLVGRWCRARPWAGNFLSKIVDPSFFDGICKARGYQVGEPPPPAAGASTTTSTNTGSATRVPPRVTTITIPGAATSAPLIQPRIAIWAVPRSVAVGARTSVFWSAVGVESCIETSTDGHFYESSLSGGASTVPITESTTFTIRCLVSDGSTVSGSATVDLKI